MNNKNSAWANSRMGDVVDILIGGTPSRNKIDYWDTEKSGDNVWVSIRDLSQLQSHYIEDSKEYLSDLGVRKSNVKLIPPNTVLMSFKLSIGKTAITKKSLYTNEAIAGFVIKNSDILDHEYLFHVLPLLRYETDVAIKGNTLNKEKLKNTVLELPNLSVQKKIASILNSIDNDIEKTDQIIQKTEDLKKGLMSNLFSDKESWNELPLGEATNFIDYRGKTPKKTETGIPLITAKNVRMGFIDQEPREYIASDNYKSWMTRGIPKLGDVLFTTEAPLGNVAQLDVDGRVAFAQRVIIIQPKQGISPTFLKYLLMSKKMQEKIGSLGTGGTVKGIKAKVLKQITISIPPKDEQDQIVQILSAVDTKITNNKMTLNKLANMKKGIMNDIFTRKVDVN